MLERLWLFLAVLAVSAALLTFLRWKFRPKADANAYRNQLVLLLATVATSVALIVSLPLPEGKNEQVIALAGVLLSAAIALSSTTFLGNMLAGVMLRAIRNFSVGDWIRVGEHFGRVTERELLHTELQTEDRDLVTLPNLLLVTQPVKVVRYTGTILSAEVSLGYDVPHEVVEEALLAAARTAELEEPFVSVMSLGDDSVAYRVAGVLRDVDRLLSRRSGLRRCMLDALHGAGIEIVSPRFLELRQRGRTDVVVPPPVAHRHPASERGGSPEDVVFDKAVAAERVQALRRSVTALDERAGAAEERLGALADEARAVAEQELTRMRAERARLAAELSALEDELRAKDHDGVS